MLPDGKRRNRRLETSVLNMYLFQERKLKSYGAIRIEFKVSDMDSVPPGDQNISS